MEKNSCRNKIAVMIILGFAVISISLFMLKSNWHDKRISDARNLYEEKLLEIEEYRDSAGTIKEVKVDTDFYDYGDGKYYSQVDYVEITVFVSDSLEYISAESVCKILHAYQTDIESILNNAREESGYEKILKDCEDSSGYIKYKGRNAAVQNKCRVKFESSNREYTFYPNFFYIIKKNWGESLGYCYEFYGDALIYFKQELPIISNTTESPSADTQSSNSETNSQETNSQKTNKKRTSYSSYDDGYDAIYSDDDYDDNRYWSDSDYADGVDDAMDELDW